MTRWLADVGVPTYLLPEIPTLFIKSGFTFPGTAPEREAELHAFESALFDIAVAFEDNASKVAAARAASGIRGPAGRPAYVIIHDRGLVDMAAYTPPEIWASLLRARGFAHADLLARYDHVIHLSSAALGAEQSYTLANNAARTESPEHARALDAAVAAVYAEHAHRVVIAAERDFRVKLLAVERAMESIVGPRPMTSDAAAATSNLQ